MRLNSYQEIQGILVKVDEADEMVSLVFSCQHEIDIPFFVSAHLHVKEYIGEKIGIFNHEGQYFLRKI